jgi:HEPN domain-containing protein
MSQSKNLHEAKRWLLTAQQDLQATKSLSENGFFAHACFLAQQCGEKAIKALGTCMIKNLGNTPYSNWL